MRLLWFQNLGIVVEAKKKEEFSLEYIIVSEVTSFHPKIFTVLQVAIHNFQYRLRKTHAKKREGYFGMSVDLA